MPGPTWSAEELHTLRETTETFMGTHQRRRLTEHDWLEIAIKVNERHLGSRSPQACRLRYTSIDDSDAHVIHRVSNSIAQKPRITWAEAEAATEAHVQAALTRRMFSAHIADDRPIGLAFMSDQHIRTNGPIAMKRIREDGEILVATDGLYGALGGDGTDNHLKHRGAMLSGSSPRDEWVLYDEYLKMINEKILVMISGNHDGDWLEDFGGVDMVSVLAKQNKICYNPNEALVSLLVGEELYKIKLRHQYRFNSQFNLTHTVKRMWEMGEDKFDIGVVCHHHELSIEPFYKHGQQIWAARPGSYQVDSAYNRRMGFNKCKPSCPTFILFPDAHEILGFPDIRQAANILTILRKEWPRIWPRE